MYTVEFYSNTKKNQRETTYGREDLFGVMVSGASAYHRRAYG